MEVVLTFDRDQIAKTTVELSFFWHLIIELSSSPSLSEGPQNKGFKEYFELSVAFRTSVHSSCHRYEHRAQATATEQDKGKTKTI